MPLTPETSSEASLVMPASSRATVSVTGAALTSLAVTETPGGDLVAEQYMTSFFRGAQLDVHEGEEPTQHAFDEGLREREPLASVEHAYDADQTRRYSEASGDPECACRI